MVLTSLADRLRPGPPRRRVKPDDVLYGIDERPPLGTLIAIAAQHVLLALMLAIYAVLAARGVGLDPAGTAAFTAACLFGLGIGTALYGLRTGLTPGLPLINIPNPATLATYIAVAGLHGLEATAGAFVVANLAILLLSGALPRLRAYLPPEVIGVVVLMLGVSLVPYAARASAGMDSGGPFAPLAVAVALVTLAGIVWPAVWGSRRLRILAVLIGTAAGIVAALATGQLDLAAAERVAELPLLAPPFPGLDLGWPRLEPAAIVPVFLIEVLAATRQVANTLTLDRLGDAKWRRADMRLVTRSVRTLALGNVLLASMGLITGGSAAANVGLAHASGVLSRQVALVAGAMLAALAFVPAVSTLIVLAPGPVIGGILIYTAAFMIVAGMDLILSRMLNTKRSFVVGISLVVGLSLYMVPEMTASAPRWSLTIVNSGLTVAALAAILLNMTFRIGVRRSATTRLDPAEGLGPIADFLERCGRDWGARREVIQRAAAALGEAVQLIETAAPGAPPELAVRFDEVTLVCTLRYRGPPLPLRAAELDVAALLDADDARLDADLRQISALLVARLADRTQSTARGPLADLVLEFEN
jgi:xanthine/uracil permease